MRLSPPHQWRLTTRLTVGIVCLLAVLQAIVLGTYVQDLRESRVNEAEETAVVSEMLATVVDGFARDVEGVTLGAALALGQSDETLDRSETISYLSSLARFYPALQFMFLTDLDGRVIASPRPSEVVDLSERPYIRALRAGAETAWSNRLEGLETGQTTVAFARTVRGPDGAPRAYLAAAFYPRGVLDQIPVALPENASIVLFDGRGSVLYALDRPELPPRDVDASGWPMVQSALGGRVVTVVDGRVPLSDEARYGAFAPVSRTGWVVGYTLPQVALDMALWRRFAAQSAAIIALMLMVAAIASIGARNLARPLEELASAAAAIARGERPTIPTAPTDVEIMQLAEGMRMMSESVSERERRLNFLSEASAVLAGSLDYRETLTTIAHLAVPSFADWCIVDVVAEGGSIQRVAVVPPDPSLEEIAQGILRHPPRWDASVGPGKAMREGRAEVISEVPESFNEAVATSEEHLALARLLASRSTLSVPLLARGRTLGALTFVLTRSNHRYDAVSLPLAEELGRRAALALDNARLYDQAQAAVRLRDEFLSIAAHELKTPLTSLRGFAQLLLRQTESGSSLDPVRVQRAVTVIDAQSEKLALLVTQLLDVTRLESGRLSLDRTTVDLAQLARSAVETARPGAPRHDVKLEAPESLAALLDPLRVEQVLVNLIDNAIKYSPDGGSIDVEVWAPTAGEVTIAVSDEGIGIEPEHRDHIFERFYRAGDGVISGMGLGLYITRQIVEMHGGTISAEFPASGGSRFVVRLPRGGAAEPNAVAEAPASGRALG